VLLGSIAMGIVSGDLDGCHMAECRCCGARLSAQVCGGLLIAIALPRLPAVLTSISCC